MWPDRRLIDLCKIELPIVLAPMAGAMDWELVAAVSDAGGTAYLFCPESKISPVHRAALAVARDDCTALTNLMTRRPARGIVNRLMREIGPLSKPPPEFPLSAGALAPLRAKAEAQNSGDFSPLWSGQAASLGRVQPAAELTRQLASETLDVLRELGRAASAAR